MVQNHNTIPVASTCVVSQRWPVLPFSGQFADPRDCALEVLYEVDMQHKPYLITPGQNLTVIRFKHWFHFNGTSTEFAEWGRGKGLAVFARHLVRLVNTLIDLVQGTFEGSPDNPFPQMRHVGFWDFVSMDSLCGEHRQNLISFAQPGFDWHLARSSRGSVSKVNFSVEDDPPNERLKLLRAVELLNSGYYTEALLVSFALLDHFVMQTLQVLLADRGVGDPGDLLLAISSKRLKTYLGSLFKTITGHSLQEDEPGLWKRLDKLNNDRNNAMHRSAEIEYEKAKDGIETVRDILLYLNAFLQKAGFGHNPAVLGIDKLPFLLEYDDE